MKKTANSLFLLLLQDTDNSTMSYQHKSGYQKKKEKRQREESALKGARSLFEFGVKKVRESDQPDQETSSDANATSTSSNSENSDSTIPSDYHVDQSIHTGNTCIDRPTSMDVEVSADDNTGLFDIGNVDDGIRMAEIESLLERGCAPNPKTFPRDSDNRKFPISLFNAVNKNGEVKTRQWMAFSQSKQALYCVPCRLFSRVLNKTTTSLLSSADGHPPNAWHKLYERIPEHEDAVNHKFCYLTWRTTEDRLKCKSGTLTELLDHSVSTETTKWRKIFERIIDVVLFLGERSLAFRGSSDKVGDVNNGNFLGILELLSHYDPVLQEHMRNVRESQQKGERMSAHYLSNRSQNDFIGACAELVRKTVIDEIEHAKYFSIMVDATPDSAHIEQTTFILRYLTHINGEEYQIQERFLKFVDLNEKCGVDIANTILDTMSESGIDFSNCRGQGYDNGNNTAAKYNGAQSIILQKYNLCIFSPCGCHSLNLVGQDSAAICTDAVTFFGTVQTIYNLFSCSPKRWEILTDNIGCSLHCLSGTRWTDRVDSVRPFAAHLPGLKTALQDLLNLNLTSQTRSTIHGAITYVSSFKCVLMSAIWIKVLTAIDIRNQIIQARDATIDVEVRNLDSLLDDMKELRGDFHKILTEAQHVARACGITPELTQVRQTRRSTDDLTPEKEFRRDVFLPILDSVIAGLSTRFNAAKQINNTFNFLWLYTDMSEDDIVNKSTNFAKIYSTDVSEKKLPQEVLQLKSIHSSNFGSKKLDPFALLNKLAHLNLEEIFINVSISLRIFCCLPATVASAERSFSKLSLIKNAHRSTMTQVRLNDLAMLGIESQLARQLDFSDCISSFASKRARKVDV